MPLTVPAATACFLLGATILFLGVAILRDGARDRLHRVTAFMLFFGGAGALLAGLNLAVRASAPSGTEFFTQASLQFASVWEFFFPALLLFTLVFPTEHPWLRRFGWIQELIFVPYVFHLLLTVMAEQSGATFFLPEIAERVDWAGPLLTPIRVALSLLYDVHAVLFSFVNLGYVALTLTVLAARSRGVENPRLRAQLRVVFFGLGSCLLLYSLAVPVPTILGKSEEWGRLTAPLLVLALAAGSGSIAWSIIRHRFLDARLLIRRSLIFVAAAGFLATLYLFLVARIESFLVSFSGIDMRLVEPVFLMAALVLLQPLASRVEEWVDRWLLRGEHEGRMLLENLARDIVTLMGLPAIGERLTRGVFQSLVVEGAALLARREPGEPIAVVASAGFPAAAPESWRALSERLSAIAHGEGPLAIRQIAVSGAEPELAELAEIARSIPVALLVPLRHGEEFLGALAIGPKVTRTRFSQEDRSLLTTLGNQTASAVRNAHLLEESLHRAALEEELHLARQIQFSYLPSRFPSGERFEMAGRNVPSKQVGGDYYDFVETEDGPLLFTIADVVGKGVPAALLMSMLQASLRTLAAEDRSLIEIVVRLNEMILRSEATGKFATFFVARFDPATLTLRYSNAGHNPPCLLRADGRVEWLREGGLLLGAFEDPRPGEGSVRLEPGDRLVLYTDGITEAANAAGEFFDEQHLERTLRGLPADLESGAIVEAVMEAVRAFCDGVEPGDDMTLVVARVPSPVAVTAT